MEDPKFDESLKVETGSFPTSSHEGLTHLITGHKLNGQNYTQWIRSVRSSSKEKEGKATPHEILNVPKKETKTSRNGNLRTAT